jgi:hypothetical protein
MLKKKKYPKIEPKFLKDKHGNRVAVCLNIDVYESIFEEIEDLQKRLIQLKKINNNKQKVTTKQKKI